MIWQGRNTTTGTDTLKSRWELGWKKGWKMIADETDCCPKHLTDVLVSGDFQSSGGYCPPGPILVRNGTSTVALWTIFSAPLHLQVSPVLSHHPFPLLLLRLFRHQCLSGIQSHRHPLFQLLFQSKPCLGIMIFITLLVVSITGMTEEKRRRWWAKPSSYSDFGIEI